MGSPFPDRGPPVSIQDRLQRSGKELVLVVPLSAALFRAEEQICFCGPPGRRDAKSGRERPDRVSNMTTSQQIFLLFFAIFWGTSANAWPKWKPFHWPFFFYSKRVAARVLWSLVMLNIVPVIFFTCILMRLGTPSHTSIVSLREVLTGIVPAFAFFGIYRIWMAVIERWPSAFYYKDHSEQKKDKPDLECVEPTTTELYLNPKRWLVNLCVGVAYVAIAIAAAFG
jgi:hypothetical protein